MSNTEPRTPQRAFPKSPSVTLSEAKGLCAEDRILRFAQNDSDFGKALDTAKTLLPNEKRAVILYPHWIMDVSLKI